MVSCGFFFLMLLMAIIVVVCVIVFVNFAVPVSLVFSVDFISFAFQYMVSSCNSFILTIIHSCYPFLMPRSLLSMFG